MVEKYPKEVKLVYKFFPLRNHPQALPAARAAIAAYNQGKFWPYHDRLFDAGNRLNLAIYSQIAKDLGLDMQRFEADRNGQAGYEQIVADMRSGQAAEVRGTPAIYVNGLPLEERSPDALWRMIDSELSKHAK